MILLIGRILTRAHRQKVFGILGVSQDIAVGHREANKALFIVVKEHIKSAGKTVVSGRAVVAPTVGVNAPALTVVQVQAIGDARFRKVGRRVGDQIGFVGDTAGVIVDAVVSCGSSSDMGAVGIRAVAAVVGDDLAGWEGAMPLVHTAVENSDHLALTMNAIVVDRSLVGDVGLDHPAGGGISKGDIGSILHKQYRFDGSQLIEILRKSDDRKFIMGSHPLDPFHSSTGLAN